MNKAIIEEYQKKLVSADEAVKVVKSGDWVDYGDYVATTTELDAALARRKDELKAVKVRGCTCMHDPQVVKVDPMQEHFIYHDWSFTGISRKLSDKNLAYLVPESFNEIPAMYRKRIKTDVAFIAVTPMDQFGFFNMSTSCGKQVAEKEMAQKIVLEVNSSLPYCHSGADNTIHISEVDYVVESTLNSPLVELPKATATDIDRQIAALIMEQLEDGACLQLGIGGMPNMVGEMISASDIKDLGVHTEMLVDSYVDMFNAGRITNKRKNINKGKFVYTFAMGSKKLYDFLDHNPACQAFPVDYVNDPSVIAQNDKVFSVCSCLSVDLLGQVSSESVGFRQISGTGGQLDFHFASFRSKGGKGFLCMPSTSKRKDGTLESRIVPSFAPGTVVTVPSSVTNSVVTEYGIKNLKGLSTWERTEALIGIAHPDFRDEIRKEAYESGLVYKKYKIRV